MADDQGAGPNSGGVGTTPKPQWAQKKIRLHPDTAQRVDYWRRQRELSSDNEYIVLAVEEKIARENGDYDLPTLEIQRLNQRRSPENSVGVDMSLFSLTFRGHGMPE